MTIQRSHVARALCGKLSQSIHPRTQHSFSPDSPVAIPAADALSVVASHLDPREAGSVPRRAEVAPGSSADATTRPLRAAQEEPSRRTNRAACESRRARVHETRRLDRRRHQRGRNVRSSRRRTYAVPRLRSHRTGSAGCARRATMCRRGRACPRSRLRDRPSAPPRGAAARARPWAPARADRARAALADESSSARSVTASTGAGRSMRSSRVRTTANRSAARTIGTGSATSIASEGEAPSPSSARSSPSTSPMRAAAIARPSSRAASRSQSAFATNASASTEDAPHSSSARSSGTSGGRHASSGARSSPLRSCITSFVRAPSRVPSDRRGSFCRSPHVRSPRSLSQTTRFASSPSRPSASTGSARIASSTFALRNDERAPLEPRRGAAPKRATAAAMRGPSATTTRHACPSARTRPSSARASSRSPPCRCAQPPISDPDDVGRDVERRRGPERERHLGHAREPHAHRALGHDAHAQRCALRARRRHRLPHAHPGRARFSRHDVEPRIAQHVALGLHAFLPDARSRPPEEDDAFRRDLRAPASGIAPCIRRLPGDLDADLRQGDACDAAHGFNPRLRPTGTNGTVLTRPMRPRRSFATRTTSSLRVGRESSSRRATGHGIARGRVESVRSRTVDPLASALSASFRTSTSGAHVLLFFAALRLGLPRGSRSPGHRIEIDDDDLERPGPDDLHRDPRELRSRRPDDEHSIRDRPPRRPPPGRGASLPDRATRTTRCGPALALRAPPRGRRSSTRRGHAGAASSTTPRGNPPSGKRSPRPGQDRASAPDCSRERGAACAPRPCAPSLSQEGLDVVLRQHAMTEQISSLVRTMRKPMLGTRRTWARSNRCNACRACIEAHGLGPRLLLGRGRQRARPGGRARSPGLPRRRA